MLASNINEILRYFDFTDSIVTEVKWADNLLDLIVVVDYYWDIQERRKNTRLLKLIFRNCIKVDFQITKEIFSLTPNEANKDSCFTIVRFRQNSESKLLNEYSLQKHIEIFTMDYSKPWLSVLCSEVNLEEE